MHQAEEVLDQFKEIPVRRTTLRLREALQLVHDHNIYAYDAYVLDCALHYRAPLISLDNQLITIAKELEINLLEVTK